MQSQQKTIAVFGSAFDPPHKGHEDVIKQACEWADLVLVVPNYRHAFGKRMSPYAQRYEMAAALVTSMNNHKVQISNIEQTLALSGSEDLPIYTYDVLAALATQYQGAKLVFVVGPDNADPNTWRRFYKSEEILANWQIWAAVENIPVHSSNLRKKLKCGKLPTLDECPQAVIDLIKKSF
jgi:nicotinate-nucleotide adenylyltransferase